MLRRAFRFGLVFISAGLVVLLSASASSGSFRYRVDTVTEPSTQHADAVVSPLPDWSIVALESAGLGYSVDTAGDVNGDGYDDIIVGAPYYRGATLGGAAMVYHGSPTGPSVTHDWIVYANDPYDRFGRNVASAGDVNGDGYDDVLVGVPLDGTGRAHLYLGSAEGLSNGSAWTGVGPFMPSPVWFAWSIGTAGDVNGDGFDDIVIGDPNYDADHSLGGAVFVYYGSASGPQAWPDWEYRATEPGARVGWAVSAAGDINGDGFDDVITGAPQYPFGSEERGRVFVFHGSSAGLPEAPTRVIDGASSTPFPYRWGLGYDVSGAGDVNGDGFDDVVLGDPEWADSHTREGAAHVHLGSAAGIDVLPVWSFESNDADARWGGVVAGAGDVDQDGFDDIVIGRGIPGGTAPQQVDLYRGGSGGPAPVPEWTARTVSGDRVGRVATGAGDVNGDGYADVVVGDRSFDLSGAVFVYFGSFCQDLDGDELCVDQDCDDTNPNCTTDCTDIDGDGFCITVDCDDFRPECVTNCADNDRDFVCGEADCDDLELACAADCISDLDMDGVADCRDNCPAAHNPDQLDADGDGVGDACDCPGVDDDRDGVCDDVDNCPVTTNHDQADFDEDGIGDVCDPCPVVPGVGTDSDGDGICDTVDICPSSPLYGADESVNLSGDGIRVDEYDVSPSGVWMAFVPLGWAFPTLVGMTVDTGEQASLNGALAEGGIEWFAVAGDTGLVTYLADQVEGGHQLFSVPATGGPTQALVDVDLPYLYGLTADGMHAVFRCWDSIHYGLCSIPSAGGATSHHSWNTEFDDTSFSFKGFSPKGSSIVFSESYGSLGDEGSSLFRRPLSGGYGISSPTWDTRFQFADDGSWMVWVDYWWEPEVRHDLAVGHPVHGRTTLVEGSGGSYYHFDVGTTPVGGSVRVVYAANEVPSGLGIYQIPVEGGSPLLLTPKRADSVEISPDGAHVIFDDEENDLQIDLFSVPTLGGNVVKLTHSPPENGDVLDYKLSPDGQWLVYRMDQGVHGMVDLLAVPVVGGSPHRLNAPLAAGQAVEPTYLITPDSSQVIYLADQEHPGRIELYSVPIEGGAPVKLSRPLTSTGNIRNLRMAEDGSLLFYLGEHDLPDWRELHARVLDVDGDRVHRECDCDPADGDVWAVPGAVPTLRLTHHGGLGGTTTLTWTPPASPGGTTLVYDVLRSDRPDGFEPGDPAYEVIDTTGGETSADDVDPGEVFYYLIRPGNACGEGPIRE